MAADEQVEALGGGERHLRHRVGDQLEADEEPAAADVADTFDIGEAFLDHRHQARPVGPHPLDQPITLDDALDGETGSTGERVSGERVPGLRTSDRGQHGRDLVVVQRRAERHIPAAESLGDGHHVRRDPVVFERPPGAAAPGAAHHLVGDQQHAVAVADLAHHAARSRGERVPRRPPRRRPVRTRSRRRSRRRGGRSRVRARRRTRWRRRRRPPLPAGGRG